MKRIALISTFCDTEDKKEIFLKTIKKIKNLGVDVMAISPNFIQIPEDIIKECDYFFYTKENPLLVWPERMHVHWYEIPVDEKRVVALQRGLSDYGWAALYQTKKLSQIALTFDYDIFYPMIYDVDVDDVVSEGIKENKINFIYPRIDPHHPEVVWEATLHFMSLNREKMIGIEKEITLESYLSDDRAAEAEVLKWKDKFGLQTSDLPVKDLVFYWEGYDFFDYQVHPDFKIFISKNPEWQVSSRIGFDYSEELTSNLRMVFYSRRNDKLENEGIGVEINGKIYKINPLEWEIQEFPINSQEIMSLKFHYNEETIDLTNEYSRMMINLVYHKYRE